MGWDTTFCLSLPSYHYVPSTQQVISISPLLDGLTWDTGKETFCIPSTSMPLSRCVAHGGAHSSDTIAALAGTRHVLPFHHLAVSSLTDGHYRHGGIFRPVPSPTAYHFAALFDCALAILLGLFPHHHTCTSSGCALLLTTPAAL